MTKEQKRASASHGILFVALFSCAAFYIAQSPVMEYLSLSPLIIGIISGMAYGNTLKKNMPEEWLPGITFSSKKLLRLGIILYGFRLTLQNIISVGFSAILIDIIIIAGTLAIGAVAGRMMKMDKETALLASTGSAICGAAAILGMEAVLNNKPHKTAIAVSTVVIFGTLSMFLYPLLYRSGLLELTTGQWGLYTGATVHEVAHVVGAGNGMGEAVSETAVIVKMIRVIFLAPVLLAFSFIIAAQGNRKEGLNNNTVKITVPWFAFGFIAVIGFNSLNLLPEGTVDAINHIDTFLLTMAMTALGMETHLRKFKEAGVKPFLLSLILFLWLLSGGYFLVRYMPFVN